MAITWSKEWAASDDGTIIKGADLKNIQDNIDAGIGDATKIQGKTVDAPVTADDGMVLYWDDTNQKFDYKDFTAVALSTDGDIAIGDGAGDPTTLSAFTSSTGTLKHEYGGIELDISAIAKGSLISASATGTAALLSVGSNDQVLTADSAESAGIKWATPTSPGTTFVSKTAVSAAANTGDISISVGNRYLVVYEFANATQADLNFRINSSSSSVYGYVFRSYTFASTPTVTSAGSAATNLIKIADDVSNTEYIKGSMIIDTTQRGTPEAFIQGNTIFIDAGAGGGAYAFYGGSWNGNTDPTDFEMYTGSGTLTGDVYLYLLAES